MKGHRGARRIWAGAMAVVIIGISSFSFVPMRAEAAVWKGLLVQCTGRALVPELRNRAGEVVTSGDPSRGNECTFYDMIAQIKLLMDYALMLAFPITIIVLAWGGIKLMMAQEKTDVRKEVKDMMLKVMWGFVIMLGAWLAVWTFAKVIGTSDLTRFLKN